MLCMCRHSCGRANEVTIVRCKDAQCNTEQSPKELYLGSPTDVKTFNISCVWIPMKSKMLTG